MVPFASRYSALMQSLAFVSLCPAGDRDSHSPPVPLVYGADGDSSGTHPFFVLVETVDPDGDVFSPANARALCEVKRAVEATAGRAEACAADATLPGYGAPPHAAARQCAPGASVFGLEHFVRTPMLRSLVAAAGSSVVASALVGPAKVACLAAAEAGRPLAPPCALRPSLGCADASACDAPCVVSGLDVCAFLLEANPSAAEIAALPGLLAPAADARGCGEAQFNAGALERSLAALGATVAFAGRDETGKLSDVLPFEGGRMLVSKQAALRAAAGGDIAGRAPRSTVTRLAYVLRNRKEANAYAEAAGAAALEAARVYGNGRLRISWRDYPTFEAEANAALLQDARWCVGSVLFVAVYALWHTQSALLASGGMGCVLLSFPLCFWLYRVVLGIPWMGAFNFIALFIVVGIGADDVFVVVDYWRQSRRAVSAGAVSSSDVAAAGSVLEARLAWTLEHSIVSMACTSLTTAAAFATNIASPIPPARLFGIFMSSLVVANYALVVFVFPAFVVLSERAQARVKARGGGMWPLWLCCGASTSSPSPDHWCSIALANTPSKRGLIAEAAEDTHGSTIKPGGVIAGDTEQGSAHCLAEPPQGDAECGADAIYDTDEVSDGESVPEDAPLVSDGGSRYRRHGSSRCEPPSYMQCLTPDAFSRFFGGPFCNAVTGQQSRWWVLGAALALCAAAAASATRLRGPDRLFQIFRDGANINNYYLMEQRYDGTASLIRPRLIWGVLPGDGTDPDASPGAAAGGRVALDGAFDAASVEAQMWLFGLCKVRHGVELHGSSTGGGRATLIASLLTS